MSLIGAHMSVAGGLWLAISRGEEAGCQAIQIFTKNQLQWKAAPLSLSTCERFYRAFSASSIEAVVAHASYLINLAASGTNWGKSLDALSDEIDRCDQLGIDELVLHPGSHRGQGREKGLELLSKGLERVLADSAGTRVRVLLETMAGQGYGLGGNLEDMEAVFARLGWPDRLGLCLDTCHLFASGVDLGSTGAYERFVRRVDNLIGVERVGCWHLNDSRGERGGRLDRHAHLGEGRMGLVPFSLVVNDSRWERIPCLLETPKEGKGDQRNLALLRKMRGG